MACHVHSLALYHLTFSQHHNWYKHAWKLESLLERKYVTWPSNAQVEYFQRGPLFSRYHLIAEYDFILSPLSGQTFEQLLCPCLSICTAQIAPNLFTGVLQPQMLWAPNEVQTHNSSSLSKQYCVWSYGTTNEVPGEHPVSDVYFELCSSVL